MSRPISFEHAKARYCHRYTCEHVPTWARKPNPLTGQYYAPQYASDAEWYAKTLFPGEKPAFATKSHCYSSGQSWPRGQWLATPYQKGQ